MEPIFVDVNSCEWNVRVEDYPDLKVGRDAKLIDEEGNVFWRPVTGMVHGARGDLLYIIPLW